MSFKPIVAKLPNINQFKSGLVTEMKKAGLPPKQDFEKTTSTWDHKPTFRNETTDYGNRIELFVGVESNFRAGQKAKAEDIWRFVTRGTAKRHAVMSPDFSPKTRRRVIGSSSGSGGVIRVSKDIMMPGIEAREFEQVVTDKHKSKIKANIEKAFGSSAVKVNWKL
jgi:hypothetical protein